MAEQAKNVPTGISAADVIAALEDERVAADSRVLVDGTARYAELLADLGTHTTSRVCLYLKGLSDIQVPVLEEILRQSYANVKSQDGEMKRVE